MFSIFTINTEQMKLSLDTWPRLQAEPVINVK